MKTTTSPLSSQHGVGLLEVLIAVLVLSIGLLGIAALQASALRNNQSALERTQAVAHSYAILDALRAYPVAARAGTYNLPKTCLVPATGNLIAKEHQRWIQALKNDLGNDAATCGTIACVTGLCVITVEWDDSRGTGGSSTQATTTTGLI